MNKKQIQDQDERINALYRVAGEYWGKALYMEAMVHNAMTEEERISCEQEAERLWEIHHDVMDMYLAVKAKFQQTG